MYTNLLFSFFSFPCFFPFSNFSLFFFPSFLLFFPLELRWPDLTQKTGIFLVWNVGFIITNSYPMQLVLTPWVPKVSQCTQNSHNICFIECILIECHMFWFMRIGKCFWTFMSSFNLWYFVMSMGVLVTIHDLGGTNFLYSSMQTQPAKN